MSLDMLGTNMSGLPTSMGDCVTSPHGIHPSMSMYQVNILTIAAKIKASDSIDSREKLFVKIEYLGIFYR